jgi:hypothetical protein
MNSLAFLLIGLALSVALLRLAERLEARRVRPVGIDVDRRKPQPRRGA